ncbi:hypothetical protein [Serratia fonticola]|uniref:hypothetical protein n=1 Tax=Serratia fonticola TaxID=47917 RepID=UPI0016464719|nr:hypothetical protein [Serratia fonticola]MBC3216678.1 hypothetical protein [Serratia fonticola]
MITFDELEWKFRELHQLITMHLGDESIHVITLPSPNQPKNELYFNKLVSWGYAVLYESFPILYKRLSGQVRQLDSEAFKRIEYSKKVIHALRTIQCHNMPEKDPGNIKKRNLVDIWYAKNAPESIDKWENACNALSTMLLDILSELRNSFNKINSDPESMEQFISNITYAIKRHWEAHSFDEYIMSIAESLGILGMDIVSYRNSKIQEWRVLADFFNDRDHARSCIERKIKMELLMSFGSN